MSMRVTQDVLVRNSLFYLQRGYQDVAKAQDPVLTGYRINRPSDDPYGITQVIDLREEHRRLEAYQENIEKTDSLLQTSASSLQSLSTLIINVRALTIEGVDGGLNQDQRNALAMEVDQALQEAVGIANNTYNGRYLFGGAYSEEAPYYFDDAGQVSYRGDTEVVYVNVSASLRVAANIPGPEIFQKVDRGPTVFEGNTGAAPGTGTDSGRGNAVLTVSHGTTTYGGGSGVAPGTGSAAGDTIIGPAGAHTLTLQVNGTGTAGTVALDGGTAASFDLSALPDPQNFMVENEAGDRVYLDLTGLTPGFSGTVNITSTGSLSVDGGATQVPIDFSTNQVLTNSKDGTVTNVDSSGIVRTGEEYITYQGTFDLFQILAAIRDDLLNTRGLTPEDQAASLSSRLSELDDVHGDVLAALAQFGGRSQRVDMVKHRLEDFSLQIKEQLASVEEADLSEAVTKLQLANQKLQVAQAVAGNILQSSIVGML